MRVRSIAMLCASIPLVVHAGEPASGPARDWSRMTDKEKYCLVPSNQESRDCAWAGPAPSAVIANYTAHRYSKALPGFEAAASSGQTWGMWPAAIMYWMGQGTERNPARAFGLAQAAAELGVPQGKTLVEQMAKEISGADLLRSERITQEYVARGKEANHLLRQWAAEQIGLVLDPAATHPGSPVSDCTGRIPDLDLEPERRKDQEPDEIGYPIGAILAEQSSDTYVAGLVGRDGLVCRLRVIDSLSTLASVRDEVLRRVRAWKFDPPEIGGQPVESLLYLKVSHRIQR